MQVAIIPAREKSQRIRNKNLVNFLGKPIISWPITMAKRSKIFDKVIVSTDSKKILRISKKFGAEVPFLRPKKISDNQTGIIEVVNHAIKFLEKKKIRFKYVCCIFATAPLLKKKTIQQALNLLRKGGYDFVFGANKIDSKYLRSFYIKNNKLYMLDKKFYFTPKKPYPSTYLDSGQFYWGTKNAWKKNKIIFTKNSNFIILNHKKFVDINTYKDLEKARQIAKKYKI